ncbi:PAS domain S-box [Desulfosporosinus meridiei DSM 13257]|uniref:histidine kinase n=2 Tax=Desulfosporosinus TaxID=79206 RepID=J7J3S6_DESMD|nr:PAS domain S-box [Desulfosporosinus meridiei DSM 13257]
MERAKDMNKIVVTVRNYLMPMLLLALLFVISRWNYLFFHILVDGFTVTVSIVTFLIAKQTFKHSRNYYTVFLGYAFLFEGIIMLLHILTYKGMNIFPYYTSNTPTQLWIAARYISSLSLLAAPWFINKKAPLKTMVTIYVAITALLLMSILWYSVFPDCFIEGAGLTPFKVYSEYLVIVILVAAIIHHIFRKKELSDTMLKTMISSLAFSILSGLSFTLYRDVYGFTNLLGHVFSAISTYLIYKSIFIRGIDIPYERLVTEIKHSKRTEEALRESEERFRVMADNAPVLLWMSDENSQKIYFNKGWLDFTGKRMEEETGEGWLRDVYPGDLVNLEKRYQTALHKRDGFQVEYQLKSYDGQYRWVLETGIPRYLPGGIFIGYIGSCIDIDDKKYAIEALRESEERFRTIFENTSIGIKLVDCNGKILMTNPAFRKMLGYSCAELSGLNINQICHIDDKDTMMSEFRDLISEKINGFKLENRYVGKDNEIILAGITGSLVRSPKTKTKFVIIMAEDITRQREVEAHLLQMQKKEEISQRLASIGSLAAGIAHEINQPLNSVIVLVESMLYWMEKKQEISKEELTENLKEIANQADEINEIIVNLRSLIRKETKLKPHLYNLNDNVDLVINFFQNKGLVQDVTIVKNYGFILPIIGNPTTLNEVINNLLLNAIQAFSMTSRNDKKIVITTYMDSNNVYLEVCDNAIGINEGIKDKLFEPLFTTKDVGEGTGLGLSIVHSIVVYHGGNIECSSNERGGATFVVRLPLVEAIESRDNNEHTSCG